MKDTPGKPVPVTGATLEEKIANAKKQLDALFVETVRWHFNPETGTPFWLEKAKSFDFNPLTTPLPPAYGGALSPLYTRPVMMGRSGSPSKNSTMTSWPMRGVIIDPQPLPAFDCETRMKHEEF